MSRLWPLLVFLLQQPDPSATCQPPMPASSFQSNGLPMTVPASNGPVPPPPPPPPPPSDQLELIDAPDRTRDRTRDTITPYPGYIPPPPAAATFPTLIDAEPNPMPNHVHQQSSNTFRSETPLQILSGSAPRHTDVAFMCPAELTSMTDFLTCVRRLSEVTLDERNTSCDFEKHSGCRFKSIARPLSVGNFPTADHYRTFATLAGRPEEQKPSGNFVFFIEYKEREPEDEFIMSTPITCQKGNGVLKFDYWIVGKQSEVMLRVCTQNHLSRSCTQSIAYNSASSSIAIEVVHPNSTFFDLEIVASNILEPTVIVYDNIDYKAEMCDWGATAEEEEEERPVASVDSFFEAEEEQEQPDDPSGETGNSNNSDGTTDPGPLTVPSRPIRLAPRRADMEKLISELTDEHVKHDGGEVEEDAEDRDKPQTVCKLLECDFDAANMCWYRNYVNESMTLSTWQVGSERVGNPHTGVREGSGFLYVGTDSPSDSKIVNYILESADLSADADFHLTMDIYRRSNDITLQICLDTPFYCPYTISPFAKETQWTVGERFLIPRGTLKVYIRAIQWRRFKWLAIDNLRVESPRC